MSRLVEEVSLDYNEKVRKEIGEELVEYGTYIQIHLKNRGYEVDTRIVISIIEAFLAEMLESGKIVVK